MKTTAGSQMLIMYNSHSSGRRTAIGPVTKTKYGYRKHGDKFMAFESDIKVRPDLYVPVEPETAGNPSSPLIRSSEDLPTRTAPPLPPIPSLLENEYERGIDTEVTEVPLSGYEWDHVNKGYLKILSDHNIRYLSDVEDLSEEELLAIKGIGEAVTRELKDKVREYNTAD